MKIAFDSQIFTLQKYGGISRYFVKLVSELHRQDVDAKIFAAFFNNRYLPELPKLLVKGFDVVRYPPKTGRFFLALNHFVSSCAIEKFKPDIVHETYFSPNVLSGSKGSARFVTVHDMIHEKFPESFSRRDSTKVNKLAAVKRADHVICISQSTKNDLCDISNIDPDKVSVVHHGFGELTQQPIAKQHDEQNPYFLYVGQRKGYKNFPLLLKALASSKILADNINVVAFGGGAFDKEELHLIDRLGLEVKRIRQVSGSDHLLAESYANALAFVYPSLYEGFGLPPLEAMAYGCPVISSNTSSMPEVIGDAGLYFDPNSIEELAFQLVTIFESLELRGKLIQQGFCRKEKFTWRKCADQTLALYQKYF